jgi:hypothetical protein
LLDPNLGRVLHETAARLKQRAQLAGQAASSARKAGAPSPFPPGMIEIEIPDSHHHIMIDQPLALVAAIRALLAAWPAT